MAHDVDVLIPAKDPGRFLKLAVESALTQTDVSRWVTILDDHSSDPSVVTDLPQGRGVTVLRSDRTLGQCRARNRLLRETSAPWVQLLDADDELVGQDKLSRQLAAAERSGADVVYSDVRIHDETTNRDVVLVSSPVLGLTSRIPQVGTFLFRRSVLPRHEAPFRDAYADGGAVWDFVYRLLKTEAKFHYTPGVGVLYRTGYKPSGQGDPTAGVERAKAEHAP
jgi:glycosyltransferase involved in cell wall biosynthesis